jgi:hypothetical protein
MNTKKKNVNHSHLIECLTEIRKSYFKKKSSDLFAKKIETKKKKAIFFHHTMTNFILPSSSMLYK